MKETHLSRRSLLGTIGAGVVAGSAGCIGGTNPTYGTDVSVKENPVSQAPVPDNPNKFDYAVSGKESAPVRAVYFGSWKCPYCARFGTEVLPGIISDYVNPGDLLLQFRNLSYLGGGVFLGADAPNAGNAGLKVWEIAPQLYWAYHDLIFRNQPPETQRWATKENLGNFAESAGLSSEQVQAVKAAIENGEFEKRLRKTESAAEKAEINATPQVLIGGQVINALDEDALRNAIENRL